MKKLATALLIFSIVLGFYTIIVTTTQPFPTDIRLNYSNAILHMDEKLFLDETIYPTNSCNTLVTWTSSNESVATVSNYGKVTPVSFGTTTVSAKTFNNLIAECVITVTPRDVTSVSISTEYTTIQTGASFKIQSSVLPNNATYKSLTWTSSHPSIMSVDQEGNVVALSAGQATITAKSINNIASSITFTVLDQIPISSLHIEQGSTIYLNDTRTLTVKYEPKNATLTTLTWSSSNVDIIEISQEGKITAKALGNSTITVTAEGGATDSKEFTVPVVTATQFSIKYPGWQELMNFKVGTYLTLKCEYKPSNITDKTITWTSSNTDVVTIDSNGRMYAKAAGSVVITARLNGKEDQIIVTTMPNV